MTVDEPIADLDPFARRLRMLRSRGRLSETFADVEADVRAALGHGEFLLLYQPRFSLRTQDVVAIEALLRWRDPTLGMLSPPAFLPRIAHTSVMAPLGRWVLHQACLEAAHWEAQRPAGETPIVVSVNVAAREIIEPSFVGTVLEIIDEMRLAPHLLQLEVDAADSLRGESSVASRLDLLRDRGVRVAIDGASPALGLGGGRLDVDSVHLHRQWVRGVGIDPSLTDSIAALVERVHRAGGEVCAMGVEDQRQADALAAMGCDQAQGFLLCDPLLPDALGWLGAPD